MPPIRLSEPNLMFVRKEVAEILKWALVLVGSGPWAAPAFAVPKPRSTKLRFMVNYKVLNSCTVHDSTPLPHMEDIIRVVGQHRVFWKVDLKSEFWQVPVYLESIPVTAFITPDGLYQWNVMPMGL